YHYRVFSSLWIFHLQKIIPPIQMLSTQPGGFSSPFALAFASQLQQNPFHHLASLQQQLNSLAQSASSSPCQSTSSTPSMIPVRKARMGGTTMKTAKVWKYFDQLPSEEQAAECQLCRKKIKATNSSTTGMIRHLRSCHVNEYQQLQEARQNSLIVKMASETDDKTRVALLKEIQSTTIPLPIGGQSDSSVKYRSPQLSPHCASSDSGVSDSSSSSHLRPSSPLSIMNMLRHLPPGLPAPKPILPLNPRTNVKMEPEDDVMDKSIDVPIRSHSSSSLFPRKSVVDSMEERRINTQIALMLLLDSCPSSIVDRPGFRGLIKMLLPSHSLPIASQFDTEIIPDVIKRLKADLSTPFTANNSSDHTSPLPSTASLPSVTTSNETLMNESPVKSESGGTIAAAMAAASDISRSFGHSIELRREEDSDSSSSADSGEEEEEKEGDSLITERSMPARIDSFLNFIGRYVFPHEELISLLTICRAWFLHFDESPDAVRLSMVSIPPRIPTRPELTRDVSFVADNLDSINTYASLHPEIDLLPITESQSQFLRDLYAHIVAL
ncbi:bed-3, partial [Pristionchus pacificus]